MINWYDNIPDPVDSNGCIVPLGTKKLVCGCETLDVCGFDYSTILKDWFVEFEGRGDIILRACTMPDSWEKLEEDLTRVIEWEDRFMTWTCAYLNQIGDTCESCKFFNSKCGNNEMLKDVVSRIHKLSAKEGR